MLLKVTKNARLISRRYATALLAVCVILGATLATAEESPTPFRIGFVVPLSGPTADFGFAIQSCLDLARRDRPELSFGSNFSESSTEIAASIAVKESFVKRYHDRFNSENALIFGAAAYEFAMTAGELFNKTAPSSQPLRWCGA